MVGADVVDGWAKGDRVIVISPRYHGCYGTVVSLSATHVHIKLDLGIDVNVRADLVLKVPA
jgi:preprotein translocase subunit YajC